MYDGFFTQADIDAADAAWAMVRGRGIGEGEAAFPIEAKRDVAGILEDGGSGSAVLIGFFYRGKTYEKKNIFTAGYLGAPSLGDHELRLYANSYCFGPLTAGTPLTLEYTIDGIKPFTASTTIAPGVNVIHIPVEPTKPLIYVIPHSHYDPEWTEKYEPYNSIEMPHVMDRLRLLHEEPGHCFSLCDEAVLKPLLERRPEIVPDLRRRIEEGVCEPKASVVSTDFCMPLGESMIRQTLLGEYIASTMIGIPIKPETLWNVDVYGLSFQLPQILLKSGRKYFVMGEYRQGLRKQYKTDIPYSNPRAWDQPEFWLEGLDGSKVLIHRSWYIGSFLDKRMDGYSVRADMSFFDFQGRDFAGPDRDLVEEVKKINAGGQFKAVIATSDQFFHHIEDAPELPTIRTEAWMDIWTGSYESRVRGRQQNRKCESHLLAAETMATWATRTVGFPDLREQLRDAWFELLINHHHDPQMTPMFEGLFPEVLQRYEDVLRQVKKLRDKAVGVLANHIRTVDQPGRPIIVFNPLGWSQNAVIEYPEQGIKGDLAGGVIPRVTDANGNALPVQLGEKEDDQQPYKVVIRTKVPACGWQTIYYQRDAAAPPGLESPIQVDENGIENEHIRIDLDGGNITSITLKETNTPLFKSTNDAGLNELFIWKDDGCICEVLPRDFFGEATVTSRSTSAESKMRIIEKGPVRAVVEISFRLENSDFTQRITLNAGSRRIDFRTRVDWCPNREEGRRIRIAFSPAEKDPEVFRDIPFAALPWEQTDVIRPFTSWFAMGSADDSYGAALIPRGLHSGHLTHGAMWLTLFRSVELEEDCPWRWSLKGDQALEPGVNDYEYSLYLYEGTWESAAVPREALEVNTPVVHHWSPRQAGTLPGTSSCLSIEPEQIVVSAWMQSYTTDDTIVRAYNPTDRQIDATLTVDASSAAEVNFREEHVADLKMSDGRILLAFGPYEIKAVRLRS